MQHNDHKPDREKVVANILAIVALALFAAFIVWITWSPQPEVESANISTPATAAIVEPVAPEAQPELPVTEEAPTVAARIAPVQEAPAPAPEVQAPTTPRSADMLAAGIAEADHQTVAALLLNADGTWVDATTPGARYAQQGTSPVDVLVRANEYALGRYGSWSAALAFSQGNEGRW